MNLEPVRARVRLVAGLDLLEDLEVIGKIALYIAAYVVACWVGQIAVNLIHNA